MTELEQKIKLRFEIDVPDDFERFNAMVHDGADKRKEAAELMREALTDDSFELSELEAAPPAPPSVNRELLKALIECKSEMAMMGFMKPIELRTATELEILQDCEKLIAYLNSLRPQSVVTSQVDKLAYAHGLTERHKLALLAYHALVSLEKTQQAMREHMHTCTNAVVHMDSAIAPPKE